jgi:hypothetical protein
LSLLLLTLVKLLVSTSLSAILADVIVTVEFDGSRRGGRGGGRSDREEDFECVVLFELVVMEERVVDGLVLRAGVGAGVISVEGETSTSSASLYHFLRRV